MATVLITGARAPVALEMARSFREKGHRVVMADSMSYTLARWSNSVNLYYHIPSPAHEFAFFRKKINEIIREEKIEHLIPTCEETFYISMCPEFAKQCKVWTSGIEVLDSLHNKLFFSRLAVNYFNVPQTVSCSEFNDWKQAQQYVFKPVYSRFASSAIIARKEEHCNEPKKHPDGWVAQQYVDGKEISVYSLWDNGVLKAFVSYHSKYRAGQGAGIFFETVWHEETFAAVKKMGEELRYTGQLCFDIILHNDKPYVLECNPRATSGAHILNKKLADVFLEKEAIIIKQAPLYMIGLAVLFSNPIVLFRKEFYKGNDVLFRLKDLKPALLQLMSLAELWQKKWKYKISWLQATTEDIEWNGKYDQMG